MKLLNKPLYTIHLLWLEFTAESMHLFLHQFFTCTSSWSSKLNFLTQTLRTFRSGYKAVSVPLSIPLMINQQAATHFQTVTGSSTAVKEFSIAPLYRIGTSFVQTSELIEAGKCITTFLSIRKCLMIPEEITVTALDKKKPKNQKTEDFVFSSNGYFFTSSQVTSFELFWERIFSSPTGKDCFYLFLSVSEEGLFHMPNLGQSGIILGLQWCECTALQNRIANPGLWLIQLHQ